MCTPMTTMTLRLPAELLATARRCAKAQGLSLSEYIRRAIADANRAADSRPYHPILDAPPYPGRMPRDGARNHDRYSYGRRR